MEAEVEERVEGRRAEVGEREEDTEDLHVRPLIGGEKEGEEVEESTEEPLTLRGMASHVKDRVGERGVVGNVTTASSNSVKESVQLANKAIHKGVDMAFFYPTYLWIILGNGFRFGPQMMMWAIGVATGRSPPAMTCRVIGVSAWNNRSTAASSLRSLR